MAITTTTLLPAPIQQSFSYKLLSVPTPYMIHGLPAMKKMMPTGDGNIMRQRRYNPLGTATVPLGDSGITPPAQTLSAVDIDAAINFYGTYIYINEQVTLAAQDRPLNEATQRLGVSLRQTEDELTRNMLASTAAFVNCVNGTNGDNPTELNRTDIDGIVQSLLNNDGRTIESNIEGDDKFGTAPVRDAFFAMCKTDLLTDLEAVRGFIAKAQYPTQGSVMRPEWGCVSNVRFFLSSIGSKTTAASMKSADVFNIFIVGMEAYTIIEQDGYSAQFIYRPPIYDGPLALNASVGYKFAQAMSLSNDAWVMNLRATLNV